MTVQPGAAPRLLVVPGLHDSGPAHWQSWLESLHPDAVRVVQADWSVPDVDRWAAQVGATLAHAGADRPWLAVAHSFGCLAVARHLRLEGERSPIAAVLLVAPAEPDKFGVGALLPQRPLGLPATLVASRNDPWMRLDWSRRWAERWGCHHVDLGDAGHINAEAGFGRLPLAGRWVRAMEQRAARRRRPAHAAFAEWSFAV